MAEAPRYQRFSISDRIEHWVQIGTFVPLAITGLVQKYAGAWLSERIIDLLGGIEAVRIQHRVFAGALMIAVVYHYGAIGYRRFVLRAPREMIPGLRDIRAAGQALAFNLGLRKSRPVQGRYTFEEKIEYWSLVWGAVIMIVTGFLLWNPIASAQFLPGDFIPAAKVVHGGEAVLAVLAILVWHIYHVHIRHFNTSIFTGYISRELMLQDHPLELAAIEAGERVRRPPPDEQRRRQRVFLPACGTLAMVMLAGIWLFVTFEKTAIGTIEPAEQVTVFAPLETTVPVPTSTTSTTISATTSAPPPGDATWEGVFADLLAQKCGVCHSATNAIAGLDLSSYDAALAGGGAGPGIVPGEPDQSQVLIRQAAGGHPGQLTAAEIATLRTWIVAGAPER